MSILIEIKGSVNVPSCWNVRKIISESYLIKVQQGVFHLELPCGLRRRRHSETPKTIMIIFTSKNFSIIQCASPARIRWILSVGMLWSVSFHFKFIQSKIKACMDQQIVPIDSISTGSLQWCTYTRYMIYAVVREETTQTKFRTVFCLFGIRSGRTYRIQTQLVRWSYAKNLLWRQYR